LKNEGIEKLDLKAEVLSRMPERDRNDYEFPENIQDFVFYEGFDIRTKDKVKLEFVPLSLTSNLSKRKFALA